MTDLGVGIIGCGNISAAYLRLGPMFRGLEFRAVADLNPAAAELRANEFGVRADTVEALLAADDIDAVVNLTVPAAHFAVTRAILEAGKHAYSEKPLVLTLEEGEALRSLADARGLRVGSAPDTFLGGVHQQARALLDDGAIGRVVHGSAHVMSRGMEHWHPNPDFFFQPGAGPVLDVGPYYITNLIQLLGPVRQVAALTGMGQTHRTILSEARRGEKIEVTTPTTVHALMDFASGAKITLGASWDTKSHGHAPMELYGTDGSLFVPDPNFFGGPLRQSDGEGEISEVAAWDHPFGVANQGLDGDQPRANYRVAGLADMAAALATGRPHRCSIELAIHAVECMTAILRSGEEERFIDLSSTCDRPAPLDPDAARELLR